MNDSKNLILAVVLSALVLLGWSWAANRYFPTASTPPSKSSSLRQPSPSAVAPATPAPASSPPKAAQTLAQALASGPRVSIRTPTLVGSINLKGAQIDDLQLVQQKQTIAANSPPVRLLSPLDTPGAYFATFGWTAQNGQAPPLDALWTADSQSLTPGHPVTLSTQTTDGARFQIRIGIDDGYLFTVQQSVTNGSGKPLSLRLIGLVTRATQSADKSMWTNHVGPIGVFNGKVDYSVNWKDVDEGKAENFDNTGWLGFTDKYWLTALVPQGSSASEFRKAANGGYQADYETAPLTVGPGQTLANNVRFFAGVKEKALLDRYEQAGVPLLSYAIDWGWFWFFARPIFDLLLMLFHAVGNFGLAIICLTLIVRGVMFPIAQKQFQSMAAMRKLQPKMKAIQERFKDDKQRQQQEILKLYQAEKVNPAAGCLPIVLQIPVFYALYKTLVVSVEMRHQPFIGWIKDLSAPDPLTPVNLFGLLHFTPPAMLAIGVLPLMVGATQWISMKLNPQPMDPAQAQMFAIMPWFLVFIMAPFAAGLQLYWITNNLLTIAQQWFLYRKFGLHLSDTHPVHMTGGDEELAERARKIFAGPVEFLKSAPSLQFLPDPEAPEIAFAGRSNVGKSSLLNALTNRKNLARTSNTPGRTQELNFFDVGKPLQLRLVDMPGYGFAEAPKDLVRRWRNLVNDYLRGRAVLKRALVLIDSRHGLKDVDREMMRMLDDAAVSYHLVLTKGDKIKPSALGSLYETTASEAAKHPAAHPSIFTTSSETGSGIDQLRAAILQCATS